MFCRNLLLSFLCISTTCALALQTKSDESASNPTSIIIIESSSTPSLASTDNKNSQSNTTASAGGDFSYDNGPQIYLPVTVEPPDILGIGNVSGFYGPGSWAAWFLSITASWWRLLRASEEKFDPNTWLFLLGTNWAAVGLFRGIRLAQSIPHDSPTHDTDLNSMQGSIAAAFTVTFWGLFHISIQYLVTIRFFDTMRTQRYRLWTLLLGMILPSLALLRCAGSIRTMNAPALYWHGMYSGTRELNLLVAAGTPYYIMPFSVFLLDYSGVSMLPSVFTDVIYQTFDRIRSSRLVIKVSRGLVYISMLAMILSIIMIEATENEKWLFGMLPLAPICLYMIMLAAPLFWVIVIGILSTWYVIKAYLVRSVKRSQSCVFMPCAPQSINEEDQLFALFAGLLLFLGWEILPVLVRGFKKRYRDRQEFVQHMEERMRHLEMRRTLQRRFGWEGSNNNTIGRLDEI
ncbi:hypothetical protein N7475_003063 [Penicillium sp. IBT 31633x]|nr:hypothetical protein N7475_003063 [Penicillium sp. IBT 31633x]